MLNILKFEILAKCSGENGQDIGNRHGLNLTGRSTVKTHFRVFQELPSRYPEHAVILALLFLKGN